MKIGIDAKWFYSGPISGQVIIRNLLPDLIRQHPEHDWHIFLNKKDRHSDFPLSGQNIHLHYAWSILNMFSNFFTLPMQANKLKLDAVLFQTFAPRSRTFKSLVFVHDILFEQFPEFFTWKEKLYFTFVKKSCSSADKIITTTETVKKDLIKYKYAGGDKIDIAPLGVSKSFKPLSECNPAFLARVKNKYQLPDNYLLFTGRLNIRKNIEAILKILPLIEEKIYLVIAGEKSWKQSNLSQFLKNKKNHSRVLFIGKVTDDDLAAIYSMANIFCFPSFAEGFGLPPLEAMASGIPAVVSNATAIPEVCGEAAVYIDPNNPEDIAEKINRLLTNNLFYEKKVKEGLVRSEQFTWKRTAESIMKSILTTLETRKTN